MHVTAYTQATSHLSTAPHMPKLFRRRRTSDATPATAKLRKPPNTAFRQQRLKAWQPLLTPGVVVPFCLVLALIFTPLGIALLFTNAQVRSLTVDYSHCDTKANGTFAAVPKKYVSERWGQTTPEPQWRVTFANDTFGDRIPTCEIQFKLSKKLQGPLYLYYKLTNFHQNHRLYVQLFDWGQLKGKAIDKDLLNLYCDPITRINDTAVFPCGLVANLVFNDTFSNLTLVNPSGGDANATYVMSEKDISWSVDRDTKFRKTLYNASEVVPPPNWHKLYPDGYTEENLPDLSQMEHLQVWMRTAGLPSFYKLYSKNTTATFPLGEYVVLVEMNYPVSSFGGTKLLVLSTSKVTGGRNYASGVLYLVVAGVLLLMLVGFLLKHLVMPRKLGDPSTYFEGVREQL